MTTIHWQFLKETYNRNKGNCILFEQMEQLPSKHKTYYSVKSMQILETKFVNINSFFNLNGY